MPGAPHTKADYEHLIGTVVDECEVLDVFQTRMDNGALRWKVKTKCTICGKIKAIVMQNFKNHAGTFHKYCTYNDKHKYDYLIGQTFDDGMVIDVYGKYFNNNGVVQGPYWNAVVKCNICHHTRDIFISELIKPDNHSAKHINCLRGLYPHRFVNIWDHINARCKNEKNKAYPDYGGRGIKCEWNYLDEFARDMLDSYNAKCAEIGENNVSIERMNVDENYCKENCIWIDIKFQYFNKRNTIFFYARDPKGVEYRSRCLEFFCHKHGLDPDVMRNALTSKTHIATNGWYICSIPKAEYDAYLLVKFNVPADLNMIMDCLYNIYNSHKMNPAFICKDSSVMVTVLQLEAENLMYVPPEALPMLAEMDNPYGLEIEYVPRVKKFYIKECFIDDDQLDQSCE